MSFNKHTIEFEIIIVDKTGEAEQLKAEKEHIKKMLDKAFSEFGTWLQIGQYHRFKSDEVLSVVYHTNDESRTHQIFIRHKHSDYDTTLEMPFGFLGNEK